VCVCVEVCVCVCVCFCVSAVTQTLCACACASFGCVTVCFQGLPFFRLSLGKACVLFRYPLTASQDFSSQIELYSIGE
jgi:hypothetical protein